MIRRRSVLALTFASFARAIALGLAVALLAAGPGCASDGADCLDGAACQCTGDCELTCGREGGAGCDFQCDEGTSCTFDCPGGGCDVQCQAGSDCEVTCPGGACNVSCSGAERCVLEACDERCVLDCGGSTECQSSCDLADGCVVTP